MYADKIGYVRDNPRLVVHYMIVMHYVEAKNHLTRSAEKLCNAHLAMDYATYTMVTCQH